MLETSPKVDHLARYFSAQVTDARRFHLRLSKFGKRGIRVVGGGVESCRSDYLIDRAGFPYPILEFVAAGSGRLVMNRRTYDLVPGTLFTYGKGVGHRIQADQHHPMLKYFIVISGRDSIDWLSRHMVPTGSVVQIAQPDRIRQILDDIIDFGLRDRPDREHCCMQALTYLMLKLSDQIVPLSKSGVRSFHTYQRCRNYIEINGLTLRSMREVAVACHVDEAYLCRLFQRFGRERPFHYLQHIRMNHAMTLLQTTDRLIKDIAEELHFEDAANFTRAFRAWFGLPPIAIRHGMHAESG
jgi:AraC-like DNA-binding protein